MHPSKRATQDHTGTSFACSDFFCKKSSASYTVPPFRKKARCRYHLFAVLVPYFFVRRYSHPSHDDSWGCSLGAPFEESQADFLHAVYLLHLPPLRKSIPYFRTAAYELSEAENFSYGNVFILFTGCTFAASYDCHAFSVFRTACIKRKLWKQLFISLEARLIYMSEYQPFGIDPGDFIKVLFQAAV